MWSELFRYERYWPFTGSAWVVSINVVILVLIHIVILINSTWVASTNIWPPPFRLWSLLPANKFCWNAIKYLNFLSENRPLVILEEPQEFPTHLDNLKSARFELEAGSNEVCVIANLGFKLKFQMSFHCNLGKDFKLQYKIYTLIELTLTVETSFNEVLNINVTLFSSRSNRWIS